MTVSSNGLAVDSGHRRRSSAWVSPTGIDGWSGRSATAARRSGRAARHARGLCQGARRRQDRHHPEGRWLDYFTSPRRCGSAPRCRSHLRGAPGCPNPSCMAGSNSPRTDGRPTAAGSSNGGSTLRTAAQVVDLHITGSATGGALSHAARAIPRRAALRRPRGTSGHQAIHIPPGGVAGGHRHRQAQGGGHRRVQGQATRSRSSDRLRLEHHPPRSQRLFQHQLGEGSRYYLFNSETALDAPGEWYSTPPPRRSNVLPEDPGGAGRRDENRRLHHRQPDQILARGTFAVGGSSCRRLAPRHRRNYEYLQIGGGASRWSMPRTSPSSATPSPMRGRINDHSIVGADRRHHHRAIAGNGIYIGCPGARGSSGISVVGNTIRDIGLTYIESAGSSSRDEQQPPSPQRDREGLPVRHLRRPDPRHLRGPDPQQHGRVQRHPRRQLPHGRWRRHQALRRHQGRGDRQHPPVQLDRRRHPPHEPAGRHVLQRDDWNGARWPQPISAGLYLDWNINDTAIVGNLVTTAMAACS